MAVCSSKTANQDRHLYGVERKSSEMNQLSVSISASTEYQKDSCSHETSNEESMELRSMFYTENESLTSGCSVLESFSDLNMNQFSDIDSQTISGSLDLGFSSEDEDRESYLTEDLYVNHQGRKKTSRISKSGSVISKDEDRFENSKKGEKGDDIKGEKRAILRSNGPSEPELEDNDWENLSWRYLINRPQTDNLHRAKSWSADEASKAVKQSRRKSCGDPEEFRKQCSIKSIQAARERVQDAALQLVEAQLRQQEVQRRQSLEDRTGEEGVEKEANEGIESKGPSPRRKTGTTQKFTDWLSGRSRGSRR